MNIAYRDPPATPCPRGCTIPSEHTYQCADTTDKPCRGCLPDQVHAGTQMCRACGRGLRRRIAELPTVASELHRGLEPAAGPGGGGAHLKPGGSPDFASKRGALEHLGQIVHDLAWLTGEVAERQRINAPVHDRARPLVAIQRAATWLTVHLDWMLTQDDVPVWADTIADIHRRAITLADRGPRTRFPLGGSTCPEPGCGAELVVTIHDDDPARKNARPGAVTCKGPAAHTWSPAQWTRLGQRLTSREAEAS